MRQAEVEKQNLRHATHLVHSARSAHLPPQNQGGIWHAGRCRESRRTPDSEASKRRLDFLGRAGNGWLQVLRVQHGPESANPKNPTSESLQQVYAILLKACWNELCKAAGKSAFILTKSHYSSRQVQHLNNAPKETVQLSREASDWLILWLKRWSLAVSKKLEISMPRWN